MDGQKKFCLTISPKLYVFGLSLAELATVFICACLSIIELFLFATNVFLVSGMLILLVSFRLEAYDKNLLQLLKQLLNYYLLRRQKY